MKMMEKKILISMNVHSVVDSITNSSTEMFTVQDDRDVELIKGILMEAVKKFQPTDVVVPYVTTDISDYEARDAFDLSGTTESMISYLRYLGYTVDGPGPNHQFKLVSISWERGALCDDFIDYIKQNFNVISENDW